MPAGAGRVIQVNAGRWRFLDPRSHGTLPSALSHELPQGRILTPSSPSLARRAPAAPHDDGMPPVSRPLPLDVPEEDRIEAAVRFLAARTEAPPRVGLILGTGLGGVAAGMTEVSRTPYGEIPYFPRSTALSHAGEWLSGRWENLPVAVMSGRFHLYEGYSLEEITRPVRVMAALGVETLIVTNAAGGLASGLAVGDLLLLEDHINFTTQFPVAAAGQAPLLPCRASAAYDPELRQLVLAAAEREGLAVRSGTYIGVTGPNYETRAEYRFFRQIADVVGMSTVPEALVASRCGLRVLGLSTVTNVCDPDHLGTTSGEEVAAAARSAERRIRTLLNATLRDIANLSR